MTTGMIVPVSLSVCALNALQNSMMLMPCWPSAGPTGGAGLACPPRACSLIVVNTFLAIGYSAYLGLFFEAFRSNYWRLGRSLVMLADRRSRRSPIGKDARSEMCFAHERLRTP